MQKLRDLVIVGILQNHIEISRELLDEAAEVRIKKMDSLTLKQKICCILCVVFEPPFDADASSG